MLRRILDRFRSEPVPPDCLYDSIVAAARQPRLYADWGVPDTPAGRIEMVAVHTAVVTHALMALGASGEGRARALHERFVTDMDDNMREIGVGDLTVPRKVKKAAAAVYDRVAAIDKLARAGSDEERKRAAEALIEIDGGGEQIDRAALGRYFCRLFNELSSSRGVGLLAAEATIPQLADLI